MSSPQTTSLKDLLGNDHPHVASNTPTQQVPPQNPSAQFAQMPGGDQNAQPATEQQPTGPGQGVSIPEPVKKEFFASVKEFDYKSAILVFAIILILSSGIFYSILRPYIPGSVGSDGKVTLIGSLIAAVIGTIIYILVKLVGKF